LIDSLRLRDWDIAAVTVTKIDPSKGAIKVQSQKLMNKILKAQISVNDFKITFR
jgi:hypothetical protein